jgi:HlyD family secretion protein
MAKQNNGLPNGNGKRRAKVIGALAVVVLAGMAIVWLKVVRGGDDPASTYATFSVRRGPLTISVLETGTIKSRDQQIVKNEVEGRTSIVWLIDEGVHVKKGDLLVELDSSNLVDARIDQQIKVKNAEAAFINAEKSLAVVKNQALSDIEKAELTHQFAVQDLDQYEEGQYPKDVNEVTARIRLAQEELKRAEDVNDWSERLYTEKYLSETEYMADRLSLERKRLDVDLAVSDRDLLENFTYHRQIDQLKSDARQAELALQRTKDSADASIVQAEAELDAKKLELSRQQEKLEKIEDQLQKTKLTAPADGMVIYATTARRGGWRDNREPLDEGVEVFERQELIYLPTTASATAEVDIHEASLEKVRLELPVIVTVDALPDKKFLGKMGKIAPLPDPQSMWMNPDLKVYNSEIYLEGDDPALRTGMSCKAEIIVEQHTDALYIPVHAVLRVGGKPTVYVLSNGTVAPREVETGLDDLVYIRIISGLQEGEEVLLEPPLNSAAVDAMAKGIDFKASEAADASDEMKERISQKLQNANGREPPEADVSAEPDSAQPPAERSELPGAAQMEQMRRRFENMSEEERQAEIEKIRKQFENMSPEEREKLRERFQGMGRGPGQGRAPGEARGPGQGRAPGEGRGPGQGRRAGGQGRRTEQQGTQGNP